MLSRKKLQRILYHELSRIRRNEMQTELAARGLGGLRTPMILFALEHLGQQGEITMQRELENIFHVSPSAIAIALKSLQRDGYVEKRPDPADARRKHIVLTPKGINAMKLCKEVFRTVDERMFRGFKEEEMEQLMGYFRRMIKNLMGNKNIIPPNRRMRPTC